MSINVLVISDYRNYIPARPEAEIFIGLAKMGFQIQIMTYKDAKYVPEFIANGIKVIEFHPERKMNKAEIHRIRKVLKDENIQILHLFNSKAIINGIQAAKGLPVKVVLYRGYAGNVHWYDPTAYFKYLHPRVDAIFCNAKGVEKSIQKQLFFDKRKAITIYKGHDIAWYEHYRPVTIRKDLGIPEDAFLLVNVANNRKMKGIPYLLEALNQLPDDIPIHLLLIGMDMDNQRNLKIISRGKKEDCIHFLGFRKDAPSIVMTCDVFVFPSIKGEGMPKAVMEAMALEIAPIVSDIPGNNELVVNGESGIIVPPKSSKELAKAILKLYNDRVLCNSLGIEAKKRIEKHFNTNQTVLKIKKLYEDLLS
ncbi:MAG: glycosyltransferase family 4 protein [Bacteroidetes bacterium]|nr:glycosyltransferase family 4 protein [Bacteroidota bacterium]